eukprot:scaffold382546_cov43-Prasinocladus_malaysianus.AAC.1
MAAIVQQPPDEIIIQDKEESDDTLTHDSREELARLLAKAFVREVRGHLDCFRRFDPSDPQLPLAIILDPRHRGGPFLLANGGDAQKATKVLREYDELLVQLAAK